MLTVAADPLLCSLAKNILERPIGDKILMLDQTQTIKILTPPGH